MGSTAEPQERFVRGLFNDALPAAFQLTACRPRSPPSTSLTAPPDRHLHTSMKVSLISYLCVTHRDSSRLRRDLFQVYRLLPPLYTEVYVKLVEYTG